MSRRRQFCQTGDIEFFEPFFTGGRVKRGVFRPDLYLKTIRDENRRSHVADRDHRRALQRGGAGFVFFRRFGIADCVKNRQRRQFFTSLILDFRFGKSFLFLQIRHFKALRRLREKFVEFAPGLRIFLGRRLLLLRLFLRANGRTLTETWTMPWSAPTGT